MKDKNIFDILENAENDSMKRLIDKCPEISDEQLEKIFKMSEKKFRKQRAEKERTERDNTIKMTENYVVEGVERNKRPVWLTPLTTAASVLLIAGIAIGSTAMLKRHTKPNGGGGGVTPAVTVSTTTGTSTNIVSTDKNGSTVTGSAAATTTTTTVTSAVGDNAENTADTEFIKPFVGRWRYEMSSVNDLDIPESAGYMGTAVINDDATYIYTDISGNVSHGTISNAAEEIGGTSIQCLDFSGNESGANVFLDNRAYYVESRPYELHFGNSNIARLVREDHVEPIGTSWQSAYRKELIDLLNQGTVYNDPMWDLQDIDNDGTPELLISTGTRQNDHVLLIYYDNGKANYVSEAYAVSFLGEYGVMGICKEEHLMGWTTSYDSYYQTWIAKFENHRKTEEVYAYDPDAASYGGSTYSLNGLDTNEDEYNAGIAKYNSKNWVTVGRQYSLGTFSPLMDN
jgi:hypothetical protein